MSTKISIKDMMARNYAANGEKTWAHDRSMSVGASQIGHCLRQTWFDKQGTPADPDYVDRFGAKVRGNLIEQHYWEPGVRAQLPAGVSMHIAGAEQRTLVDGYLSATSDGVLDGVARDCLAWLGVPDIGADCLVVECKSIDPRVDLQEAKAEHAFQVQAQMGLIRHATNWRPNYALVSYTDASFLDDVTEFAIAFDEHVYAAAKARATRVMTTVGSPMQLPPEGKLAGGRECKLCPYASRCAEVTVQAIPQARPPLSAEQMAQAQRLRIAKKQAKAERVGAELAEEQAEENIKLFLRLVGTNFIALPERGQSISYGSVKGRKSLDREAVAAAGIDLTPFEKEGSPSDRLTIK